MLKISKNGELYSLNEDNNEWDMCDILDMIQEDGDDECIIDEGVTLGDVFTLIEKYEDILSEKINNNISVFIDEMSEEVVVEDSVIEYIELSWRVEQIDGFLEDDIQVNGWHSTSKNIAIKDENGNIPSSIGFISVNNMKNTPIVANESYNIIDIDSLGVKEYMEKVQAEKENLDLSKLASFETSIFSIKKHFTLMEILDALFFEISIFGLPKQRDAFKEQIMNTINNSENENNQAIIEIKETDINPPVEIDKVNTNSKKDILDEIDSLFDDIDGNI